MSWEYRVVRRAKINDFAIFRYSPDEHMLVGCSVPMGNSVRELEEDVGKMVDALKKPYLVYEDYVSPTGGPE